MRYARWIVLAVGALATLMGVIWLGQGTGYFPYPASSFMIDQTPWAWRGLAVAVGGVVLMLLGRRLGAR
jgi:hypothetical protein